MPSLDPVWQQEIALPSELVPLQHFEWCRERFHFQVAFLARMVFSCLVDADFVDTEAFYALNEKGVPHARGGGPPLEVLRDALNQRLATFKADSDVNRLRGEILSYVRAQAGLTPGRFTLTFRPVAAPNSASLLVPGHVAARSGRADIYGRYWMRQWQRRGRGPPGPCARKLTPAKRHEEFARLATAPLMQVFSAEGLTGPCPDSEGGTILFWRTLSVRSSKENNR